MAKTYKKSSYDGDQIRSGKGRQEKASQREQQRREEAEDIKTISTNLKQAIALLEDFQRQANTDIDQREELRDQITPIIEDAQEIGDQVNRQLNELLAKAQRLVAELDKVKEPEAVPAVEPETVAVVPEAVPETAQAAPVEEAVVEVAAEPVNNTKKDDNLLKKFDWQATDQAWAELESPTPKQARQKAPRQITETSLEPKKSEGIEADYLLNLARQEGRDAFNRLQEAYSKLNEQAKKNPDIMALQNEVSGQMQDLANKYNSQAEADRDINYWKSFKDICLKAYDKLQLLLATRLAEKPAAPELPAPEMNQKQKELEHESKIELDHDKKSELPDLTGDRLQLEDKSGEFKLPPPEEAKPQPRKRKKLAAVDISSAIEQAAMQAGEEKVISRQAEVAKEKGVKGWLKKVWRKLPAVEEYHKYKEISRVRKAIELTGNIFVAKGGNQAENQSAKDAVIERFISEFEEESVHKLAGEKKTTIEAGTESPQILEFKKELKELLRSYAETDTMDEKSFIEAKNRLLNELNDKPGKLLGEGRLYADNYLEVAKDLRQFLSHGEGLEKLDEELTEIMNESLVFGEAKTGARTELEMSLLGKLSAKIVNDKWAKKISQASGLIVPEAVCVAAVAAAIAAQTKQMGAGIFRSKVAQLFSLGASGAIAGGLMAGRENKRLKAERRLHQRQLAEGGVIGPESPRREQMDKFAYSRKNALELKDSLENSFKGELDLNGIDQVIGQLGEIEARIAISDGRQVDLIGYSDAKSIEQERLNLDISRAKIKAGLKKVFNDKIASGEITAADLGGVDPHNYIRLMIDAQKQAVMGPDKSRILPAWRGAEKGLNQDIEAVDKAFNKMKLKKVGWAFVKGAAFGVAAGVVVQEIGSMFLSNKEGLAEHILKLSTQGREAVSHGPEVQETMSLAFIKWLVGEKTYLPTTPFNTAEIAGAHISLPDGVDLVHNAGGDYSLVSGGQVITDHLAFNPDGSLTPASHDLLSSHGILAAESHVAVTEAAGGTAAVSPKDYLGAHESLFHKVHRVFWHDNNTPKIFDKNELKLWWGGEHNTGLDAHGNYVYNVKHMAPDGSSHGQFSVDAQEAIKNGKLRMLLSMSKDTQGQPVEVPIDANGNAVIDPNSWIGKTFFKVVNGKAEFLGRYAEVAQDLGVKDGVEQYALLATHEGAGLKTIADMAKPFVHDRLMTDFYVPQEHIWDTPLAIPVDPGREALEPLGRKETAVYPVYPEISKQEEEKIRETVSPRLQENPEAKLKPKEEINWYFSEQKRLYPGYTEQLAKLNEQTEKDLAENTKAIVAIAVAGGEEHKNIYRTLETLAVQKKADKQSIWQGANSPVEILLYVNWKPDVNRGNLEETRKEIARFKRKYPEVNLELVEEEVSQDTKLGWIKKKLFDLSLYRKWQLKDESDMLIIANDADMTYSSETYLSSIIAQAENPDSDKYDAWLGRQDLDPRVYEANPIFHSVMRFWQFLEAGMRRKTKTVGTQGRNTIFKASTYAAIGDIQNPEFYADIVYGKRIQAARQRPDTVGYSNGPWVMVDPRREIDKFRAGEKVAYTWGDFDSRSNIRGSEKSSFEPVENLDLSALAVAEESSAEVQAFEAKLTEEFQAIVDLFGLKVGEYSSDKGPISEEDARFTINKTGQILGVKFDLATGPNGVINLKIVDSHLLREGLLKYSTENRSNTKIKDHPLFRP